MRQRKWTPLPPATRPGNPAKAQPPRPSLLEGDGSLAACEARFRQLQLQLVDSTLSRLDLEIDDNSAPDPVLAELVVAFRFLRETLTSLRNKTAFTVQVYEASLEVCLAAGDSAEAFKCMHALTAELYPEAATLFEASLSSSAPTSERWASVLSLQFLYALLSLRSPGEACRLLLRAPPAVLASPALRRALRIVRLQRVGNWPGMARDLQEGSSTLRQGLRDAWKSERQACAVVLAASHRGASWAFLERVLGAPCTSQTRAALGVVAGAADGGSHGMKRALEQMAMETPHPDLYLEFR